MSKQHTSVTKPKSNVSRKKGYTCVNAYITKGYFEALN